MLEEHSRSGSLSGERGWVTFLGLQLQFPCFLSVGLTSLFRWNFLRFGRREDGHVASGGVRRKLHAGVGILSKAQRCWWNVVGPKGLFLRPTHPCEWYPGQMQETQDAGILSEDAGGRPQRARQHPRKGNGWAMFWVQLFLMITCTDEQ